MNWRRHLIVILTLSVMAFASTSNAVEPRSKIPTPPAWIKPAFDRDLVKVEFYDPAKQKKPFPGWTDFEFALSYSFDYTFKTADAEPASTTGGASKSKKVAKPKSSSGKKNPNAAMMRVVIEPTFTKISFPVRHVVQLPQRLDTPRLWEDSLAQHELEHVAIGTHRRLEMLIDHSLRQINRVERTLEAGTEIKLDWVNKVVAEEVDLRRKAMENLIKANNNHLDKVTAHGAQLDRDRDAFFSGLYTKENLADAKFPYLSDVLTLLNSREYLDAAWTAAED